jgi:hypothetical protein
MSKRFIYGLNIPFYPATLKILHTAFSHIPSFRALNTLTVMLMGFRIPGSDMTETMIHVRSAAF